VRVASAFDSDYFAKKQQDAFDAMITCYQATTL
jgi:hypothetical protein